VERVGVDDVDRRIGLVRVDLVKDVGELQLLGHASDTTNCPSDSAFGSPYNEMTQTRPAIIETIKPSMTYAKPCINIRWATPAIRHVR
jgi:hypothetical protein